MNVIIFGASGFIGTHFRKILRTNFQKVNVIGYDLLPKDDVQFLDIRNKIEIQQKFSSDDLVINLAAVHRTPGHPDYDYFDTNLRGAKNVCEFAETKNIKNIIFTSSIAPYGASETSKTEETLPTPNTPYGISKLVAEHIHKEWAQKESSRKLLIIRPGVVFGKGECGNFTRLAQMLKKGWFFYPGRKDTIKANIYVKELVWQSWDILHKQDTNIQTYNFAYYPAITIHNIVEHINSVQGNRVTQVTIPGWLLKFLAKFLGWSGIGKALGVHPDRVNKLMVSTNISGEKLNNQLNNNYRYSFNEALLDWFDDCDKNGLF